MKFILYLVALVVLVFDISAAVYLNDLIGEKQKKGHLAASATPETGGAYHRFH